ncbi:PilZ domain-containing protein [Pseudodesulfovibrio portus]|uniref:PilZ domain-containing protein n=1 Tax=Pseudodesulfovibrio portus TaxID=231439 RepID=A0ABM8ANK7_9BACT|nr:PilZ domain-containing protein [Pseudodesulfovibrio portus]BDQ32958.1 hypothetical protein JCM14722_05000 [Pseudodesulfovibrio portus]
MGIFDAFTALFSKSGKGPKKKKKAGGKKGASKKKASTAHSDSETTIKLAAKAKGRKKSQEIHADPIDEAALGFSISLKGENEQAKKRSAIRITVKGLAVRIPRLKKIFKASDISATGLGFFFEKPRIKAGVELKMDIILDKKIVAKNVICKVRRHEKGQVGCRFVDLDRAQDDAVNKVVLLGQKQMAERKKAKKDREFKIPT